MSSRAQILQAIRRQELPAHVHPSPFLAGITFADPVAQFGTVLAGVGGELKVVPDLATAGREIRESAAFRAARQVYSVVTGVDVGNVPPATITDPHQLAGIDLAVIPGDFAVAENAAVWVRGAPLVHRSVAMITQHLAIVVPSGDVVHNLHEGYSRVKFDGPEFGVFISGPSKTADIEQSLVIGAHGARSLQVYLIRPGG